MNRNKILESFSSRFKTRKFKGEMGEQSRKAQQKDRWRAIRRAKVAEEDEVFETSRSQSGGRD